MGMARRSIRAKSNGDDIEAFHKKCRRMLKWRRGEIRRIKTAFWRRLRAKMRSQKTADDAPDLSSPEWQAKFEQVSATERKKNP